MAQWTNLGHIHHFRALSMQKLLQRNLDKICSCISRKQLNKNSRNLYVRSNKTNLHANNTLVLLACEFTFSWFDKKMFQSLLSLK